MSIELGLDRLEALSGHLPSYTRPTIHIAGTNGKGSVAAYVHSVLSNTEPPLLVGRFNSPHLVSVEDSIVVGDRAVSRGVYTNVRARVVAADQEHGTKLSSFELLTVTALQIFEEAHLDVVVMEVGLGGRLDATNIIPTSCIVASALTAVDLDHQAFLGDTVEAIAKEKAGIAREGRPFILGHQKYSSVLDVVQQEVTRANGRLIYAARVELAPSLDVGEGSSSALPSFNPPAPRQVLCSVDPLGQIQADLFLPGDHQLDNLGTALTIISTLMTFPSPMQEVLAHRLTPNSISRGVASTKWPGRLSFHTIPPTRATSATNGLDIPRPLLLLADGAHNAASAETLSSYITDFVTSNVRPQNGSVNPITLTFILGLSHSPPKTPQQTLAPILPPRIQKPEIKVNVNVACVSFTPVEGMPWVRPVPPHDVVKVVKELVPTADVVAFEGGGDPGESLPDVGLVEALNWAASRQVDGEKTPELVVLAGSLYLVADLYRLINVT